MGQKHKKVEWILVPLSHARAPTLNIHLGWGHSFKPTFTRFATVTSDQTTQERNWDEKDILWHISFTLPKERKIPEQRKIPCPHLREAKRLVLYKQQMLSDSRYSTNSGQKSHGSLNATQTVPTVSALHAKMQRQKLQQD